ncbi:serine/threonine-protein kinase [Trujillonella endophytica]|uniref:non-specific serine/threonine protein kinase n=1 Tax=Trujillonella endophytica TaxID=673521 RepID=A0A1H8QWE8_9ACTN|nr:hypothetical protein [Trujillella endophytica]SEO58194.1 Protein kinase domain-containing protein [Trujillella endophytica]
MQSDRFGPYRIEAPLGRGGAGEVYRALDTEHDRVVALRLLPQALTADAGYRERLHSAAALAAALDEPHVVPVHRSGEIEGRLFLDTRLVAGRDLAAVLAEEGPMDPARAVALVGQTARALDAASAGGVVHPGPLPSDVVLSGSGDDEFVHLTGLGLPAEPGRPADGRGHVRALAGLLVACLTGRSADAAAAGPAAAPADLPPGLEEVVRRGLSDDPGEGFATCGELAAAAEDALRDAAPGPGRAGWLPLVLGALAVVAVLAVVLVLLLGGGDDDEAGTEGPTTTAPVTRTPSTPPEDLAEEALRRVIPLNFTNVECDTGEPTPDGAVAVLGCGSAQNQPGPEDSMFFLYTDQATADAAFLADMERNGLAPLPEGAQCPGTQGHGVYTLDDGERGGRFACWIDEDNNAIWAWTQDDLPVEGLVVIVDGGTFGLDVLNTWWNAQELSEFVPH